MGDLNKMYTAGSLVGQKEHLQPHPNEKYKMSPINTEKEINFRDTPNIPQPSTVKQHSKI